MDFEDELQDKSGSGDDDLLSLASELEMDLQQHPEESPSKLAEDDDTAGSLFSDDEEDAEHGHRPVNHPTSTAPVLSAATAASAAIAGKSLPAPASPSSDSESDSDSDSDSGSDSESDSDSGSSSDSDSGSD
jgi:clumping factor A